MPRMLDLIRDSELPSNLMQSAARGALAVPPGETIEILVYLAIHHKLFGEQARLTLPVGTKKPAWPRLPIPRPALRCWNIFFLWRI